MTEREYPNLVSLLDIEGKKGYLVWANWSSGDSFGFASGKYAEPLALFRTRENADQFVQWLKEMTTNTKDCFDSIRLTYQDESQMI